MGIQFYLLYTETLLHMFHTEIFCTVFCTILLIVDKNIVAHDLHRNVLHIFCTDTCFLKKFDSKVLTKNILQRMF